MKSRHIQYTLTTIVVLSAMVFVGSAMTPVVGVEGQRNATTVISSHTFGDQPSRLIAVRNGEVVFEDTSHDQYFDVDPLSNTSQTVEYVAIDRVRRDGTGAERIGWYRHNLSTDRSELRWQYTVPHDQVRRYDYGSGMTTYRLHDIDRVNATHLAVADIHHDSVYIVNERTGERTYQWNASKYWSPETGGPHYDWTHMNDVEVLEDGRIMASPRNHDAIVFIEPESGIQATWQLGSDGNHSRLYEQHNPDYITTGDNPAVLVADSQNNRIVEFSRQSGAWRQTWEWSKKQFWWPRDADRLPNGNTLIAETNGNSILEVNKAGDVVWKVTVGRPYDAERLGTGDESRGPTAQQANLSSRGSGSVLLPKARNGIRFAFPLWIQRVWYTVPLIVCSAIAMVAVEVRKRGPINWRKHTIGKVRQVLTECLSRSNG